MRGSMTQKRDLSFAKIPAGLLWITNIIHSVFTYWSITVGGTKMEMAALFPIFFIQLPSVLLLFLTAISMLVARRDKKILLENAIPLIIYLLQVATFWFFAINK